MAARKRPRPYTLNVRVVDAPTREAWAQRLRAARLTRGWSQRDLAEHVGCTRACVSAWERAINAPPLEARIALAGALGRSPSRLFPERVAA